MRKLLILVLSFFCVTGCNLGNIPTSKVEDMLSKYQSLDESISYDYVSLFNSNVKNNLDDEYQKLIKKQYKSLVYEIKEESIDGNNATVLVEIKVLDYINTLKDYNNRVLTEEEEKELIEKLNNVKKRITYTVSFSLTKHSDTWEIDSLDEVTIKKILGIYS